MTALQRKIISIALGGIFILVVTYFESSRLEIHRLVVAVIGIIEGLVFARGLRRLDDYATATKWTTGRKLGYTALLCLGLIIVMVTIDRLINYTLNLYSLDYKIMWTYIIPGIILATQLFRTLDIWAVENEKKDSISKT